MRIHELTEAISVSFLKHPLKDEIEEQILYCTEQLGYKESRIPSGVKEYVEKHVSLSKLYDVLKPVFINMLGPLLAGGLSHVINTAKVTKNPVTIEFVETSAGGYASGVYIGINQNVLSKIADKMWETMHQHNIDTLNSESEIFKNQFTAFKKVDRYLLSHMDLNKDIDEIISTTIHEVVHAIQHDRQVVKGRNKTEYRSYLNKNNKNFYDTVNKIHSGSSLTPDEQKEYRASPQEMASFAHEAAIQFINGMYLDNDTTAEDIANIRKYLNTDIEGIIDKRFSSKIPHESKVFKRMNKLIYQEIVRYLDFYEKKITQNVDNSF